MQQRQSALRERRFLPTALRQLRRMTHSPTHSGQPVTPSAATGWTATVLFASVRESARCTVLQARSASMAQVALRTGINPRASESAA